MDIPVFSYILAIVIPYLLGSISFGILVSKLLHKDDVRNHGSGNAGTTNALRTYGGKTATLVLVGDMLKGTLGAYLGAIFIDQTWGVYIGAFAVIIGHLFPVFFKFKGGKGVATAAGTLLIINPILVGVLVVPFLLILIGTKYMSLASITVALGYPVVTFLYNNIMVKEGLLTTQDAFVSLVMSALMGLLVTFMHRANIKRLLTGTENKLGKKKKPE